MDRPLVASYLPGRGCGANGTGLIGRSTGRGSLTACGMPSPVGCETSALVKTNSSTHRCQMKSPLQWRRHLLPLLFVGIIVAAGPVFAQTPLSEAENLKARIDAAALAFGSNPRFKSLSPKNRQQLVEFVSGNMLFVLLHEMAHAAVSELGIPVLGRDEDAADSFAATRLIKLGSAFSDQVVAAAAKGWFLADRRDQKEGDTVPYYDEHGLNQVRAYLIVCYIVGSDKEKFKELARETKLPEDRQDSCAKDYSKASNSWDLVLKPHLRAPDQPKTKIDVVYGESKGKLEGAARAARSIMLLEPVATLAADQLAWPTPFTLEMQSCGFINAAWVASTHKLTLCYELAADFAELYRDYGLAPADNRKNSRRRHK